MKIDYDKYVQGNGGKNILTIGCVHGDELIGEKVIKELRNLMILNGTLVTVVANNRAMKRYALHRPSTQHIFPGRTERKSRGAVGVPIDSVTKRS